MLGRSMVGLAIHTSSPALGLASINERCDRNYQVWPIGRDLAAHLQTHLQTFLEGYTWSDLTFLAVAIGPGGFTGTRIGVVAARTLAQQLDIPLFGISSLAAVVEHQRQSTAAFPPGHWAVQMQAQRGELFGAIYEATEAGLSCRLPDQVFTQETWSKTLETAPQPYELITAAGDLSHTVPQVLSLAYNQWLSGKRPHWREVLPFYGQHPVEL